MAEFETIRPINLPQSQEVYDNDVFVIDSETGGVRKIPKDKVMTKIDDTLTETGQAADAKTVGDELNNINDTLDENIPLIQNPTKTVSGEVAHFTDGAEMPAKSVIVNIEPVQSGTGTPAPDNVRQISGWESVNVTDAGKNLFNSNADDYIRPVDYFICPIKLKMDTRYTVSIRLKSGGTAQSGFTVGIAKHGSRYQEFGSFVTIATASTQLPATVQFTANSEYDDPKIILYTTPLSSQGVADWFANYEVQLEEGTTATDYEPYTGTTTTTDLGRTVYGGTLDVVSGVLTVDRVMVDLEMLTWTFSSDYSTTGRAVFYTRITDAQFVTTVSAVSDIVSERYATSSTTIVISTPNCIGGKDTTLWCSTTEQSTTPSGVAVYPLATPQTYQLTPTEVNTLLGENNVWADAGDVSINYRRDITIALSELEQAIISLGSNV